jgi:hypothetical protein
MPIKTASSRSVRIPALRSLAELIAEISRIGIDFIKQIDLIKILRFLLPILTIAILSISMPSWGTIGLAEWSSPTPGGNEIGACDVCPGKGLTIYKGSHAYVEEIKEFGFYDRAIIGRSAKGYFAFDEQTKQAVYFKDRQQLCSQVKAANRKWNNTLRYFNGSSPIDYYAIKYSLYIFFPFIILFLIFFSRVQPNLSFDRRVDWILKSKRFALMLLVFTAFTKYLVSDYLVKATHPLDEIEDLFVDILYFIVFAIVWAIGWLFLNKIRLEFWHSPFLNSCFKVFLYVGILTIGLSLTVGLIQSPDTSIHFFSCDRKFE